ncbi:MAG: hypothetical protein QXD48_00845 [Candidatus Aenigmatarchaeota archaeon]
MIAEGLRDIPTEEFGKIVSKRIGVDKIFYNHINDVIEACDDKSDLCTACTKGDYFFIRKHLLKFSI